VGSHRQGGQTCCEYEKSAGPSTVTFALYSFQDPKSVGEGRLESEPIGDSEVPNANFQGCGYLRESNFMYDTQINVSV
jgi:hypothetical protein